MTLDAEREAIRDELAALAHTLKTPLAMIVGYAELLETRDDEETRREAARMIREAAERLSAELERALDALERRVADEDDGTGGASEPQAGR